MKKIKKNINLNDLENLLGKEVKSILMPSNGVKSNFFLIPSLIQTLVTLDRKNEFKYKVNANSSEQYEKHVFNELGFPLISYFWKKGIFNENDQNIKYNFREFTREYYKKLNTKYFATKGNSVTIASYDHFPIEKGLDKLFYDRNGDLIKNHFLIANNCQKVFTRVLRLNRKHRKAIAPLFDSLTTILWELFKNTHDHAITDEFGNPQLRNIRGIHCKFYRIDMKNHSRKKIENVNLRTYLEHGAHEENKDFSSFFEISVFDSGPGFIRRNKILNSKSISSREQVRIIKKCLTKNKGSIKGVKGDVKGFGLDDVLKCLGNKGYLRIRTEEVCIARDMVLNPYNELEKDEKIILTDWTSNSNKVFTKLPQISGSLVSILYPLNYNE